MNKTFRAERGVGRWGRRSGGVMRFFGGGMAEFVRNGRKIKKDAPKIGAGMDVHDFWRERIG